MKKTIIAFAIVSILASCGNKATLESNKEIVALKDSLQMYKNSYSTDTAVVAAVPSNFVKTISAKPKVVKTTIVNTTTTTTSTPVATTTKKKGWSKAAKGTAIGAGAGALTGVLVSKNKGKGAIIGGLLGAGAGYVIGRSKDKKDGRVKHKN
ncbi:MAG: YMGG-like glycine zipper-containing protein [Ferruginibacter sp.]